MGELQCFHDQHLLARRHFAAWQGEHHRRILFHPLSRLLHSAIQTAVLFTMLTAQRSRTLFCRAFVLHAFERGDIQGINGTQCLRRAPLGSIMLFLHSRAGASPLGRRMVQRRARRLLLRLALPLIFVIVAAVAAQRRRRQLDDPRHPRQQLTIVAGDQSSAVPVFQLLIEPLSPLTVQMVGGLIQQQIIGARDEGAAQQGLHPLAAAE